jgi:hypothetical protein
MLTRIHAGEHGTHGTQNVEHATLPAPQRSLLTSTPAIRRPCSLGRTSRTTVSTSGNSGIAAL